MSDRAGPTPRGLLPESWRVCLPIFEGPLDLLLHLVRINEVDIHDIPVATICDQFHAYLDLMEELDLDVAGEYVYEAAQLIQLKSKMLLPVPTDEAGEALEDPREELVERLIEYQTLRRAAETLAEVDGVRQGVWTREASDLDRAAADEGRTLELEEVSLFDLLGALQRVLVRYDREHPEPLLVAAPAYSVRDQIFRLMRSLEAGRPVDLLVDLAARENRGEAIAAFLAVLEMARLNLVRLHQGQSGEILLYRTARQLRHEEIEAIRS